MSANNAEMTQQVFQRVTVAKAISVSLWVRRSAAVDIGGSILVYQPYIMLVSYVPGSTPWVRTPCFRCWCNAVLTQCIGLMCDLFQHPRHRPGVISLWFAA